MVELRPVASLRRACSTMADVLEPPVHRWHSFKELTASGVLGDARRASPEKGEQLFDVMAKSLAKALLHEDLWPQR